jgi:hypothetical protein
LGGLTVYLISLQKKHRLPDHIAEPNLSDIGIDVFGRSCFLSDPGCSKSESTEIETERPEK